METSSYLDLYLNPQFPNHSPESLISMLMLSLCRLLPIISLSPFFGAKVLAHPVKVVFAISLFVIFLPQLLLTTQAPLTFNLNIIFLAAKEMFIGLSIGFLVSIPFMIVQNVGLLIDHQRGGASLMVNDPTMQNQSSPLGTLFNMMLIYCFFVIDGPFIFINAIARSYELVPIDRFLSVQFFTADSPFWKQQIKILNQIMVITIQLAGPALIMILMTDVYLGIVNRLAPQVQITFLGMPLKSLLALLVVALGLKLFMQQTILETQNWLTLTTRAIGWLTWKGGASAALP